jgi:hypothetical protein
VAHLDSVDGRMSTLVITLFAQYVVNKKMRIVPLKKQELHRFMHIVFSDSKISDDAMNFNSGTKASFIRDIFEQLHDFSRGDFNILQEYFDFCMRNAEEELGRLMQSKNPDYRFIQSLLLMPSNND